MPFPIAIVLAAAVALPATLVDRIGDTPGYFLSMGDPMPSPLASVTSLPDGIPALSPAGMDQKSPGPATFSAETPAMSGDEPTPAVASRETAAVEATPSTLAQTPDQVETFHDLVVDGYLESVAESAVARGAAR